MRGSAESRGPVLTLGLRVLVAEPDGCLRQTVCRGLRRDGFHVREASGGLDALSLLRRGGVDIALISSALPEIDGLEVVRRARRESALPIIVLGSEDREMQRIAALEAGAADYLAKPVSMPELTARIQLQLRQTRGSERSVLRDGVIELDLTARRCLIEGRDIGLTRREFDVLNALLRFSGRIHSRQQLLELVWGGGGVSPRTVDAHVGSLRRKLGPAVHIATLRGVGYRLDPIETEPAYGANPGRRRAD